ncbi:MAG TPA: ATP-binding protein [Pyrinomonadaceae bacterium]|nr:ATP-binding protein [Pyrinomonadaceae bacterium]
MVQPVEQRAAEAIERQRTEEELRNTQAELAHLIRVTTLGELTASIAHELNQPLGAIVTNGHACLRLLARDEPDIEEARLAVECMIADGMRASEVIKRIRCLLKKSSGEKSPHDINDIIREMLALVAHELARNEIDVKMQLDDQLPAVIVDPVQIRQVVLNLILNSKDAMSAAGWQPRGLMVQSERTGNEILVTVADTGIGIPSENRERVFDSFFTDKAEGLGLGLSISRTLIDAHRGKLWTKPQPDGRGAIFQFTLPVA